MKATWQKNNYRGYNLCVGETVYATVYPNMQQHGYDIYLSRNPRELAPAPTVSGAKDAALRAVVEHVHEIAHALDALAALGEEA